MQILINNKPTATEATNLSLLADELALPAQGVAIAVSTQMVPRTAWDATPLHEGDNVIGRRQPGAPIDVPIETSDMSMDRRHCILNVRRNKQGTLVYTLRDAPSLTGTFLNNEILADKDRIRLDDGAIVTIGATTFILRTAR